MIFVHNPLDYIQTYESTSDKTAFLQNNPVDWSAQSSQTIVQWAFEFQDTDLLEYIVQTASETMATPLLKQLFEHREKIKKSTELAGQLLSRHVVNTDSILLEAGRHLDADWMVLFAPFASDAEASKAYGTILHYVTPRTIGLDMWGKKLVNRFFDENVECLLETSVLNDANGDIRWGMVLNEEHPTCDLSQRITSLLQNRRLHQEIKHPTVNKIARKI